MNELFSVFDDEEEIKSVLQLPLKKKLKSVQETKKSNKTPNLGQSMASSKVSAEPLPFPQPLEHVVSVVMKHSKELEILLDSTQQQTKKDEVSKQGEVPDHDMEKETDQDAPKDDKILIKHQVKHQVAIPDGYDYTSIHDHIPNDPPARVYKFELDPFQRTAIHSIERGESVLVAAHTSAGKTVVAEYAIALSIARGQRVIYTSPIKALSNQKYRDLLAEFGDVGLMTGDVTINPSATCLVMTTEILRSMLYRGSEVMREVAWVIFDEIHYMRDSIRGVVWEETLILLADKVHFVFLSATIPNALQFASWICKIKHQPCHVVYTDYRPTPLQHYLFPAHGEGIHLVVDEKSRFREDNFQKAVGALQDVSDNAPGKGKRKDKSTKGASDLFKIIKMINLKNYHPVIVFSFSKKECEGNALQLSKIDFNGDDEKALVKSIFNNAIQSLGEDDRSLPQIEHLLPLLQRGIGIHHSGLLPILKEVIEIMFQEGLLKVLFATETFSIGLNMPAKTVVFTSVRKFDGKEQRWLSGGEYIQMSGRAGRRGLDDRGIVILMIDQKIEPGVAKEMLKGVSDPLNSAFHLTYTMILNLTRVDGVTHEYMLKNSFHQHQHSARIPEIERGVVVEEEELVGEYYQICHQLEVYKEDVRKVFTAPTYCLPFLQPGRIIHVIKPKADKAVDFGWAVIMNFQKVFTKSRSGDLTTPDQGSGYVIDLLVYCKAGSTESNPEPCPEGEKGEMVLLGLGMECIHALSTVRMHTPKEVRTREGRDQALRSLNEIKNRFGDSSLPQLHPVDDMRITDHSFVKLVEKIKVLEISRTASIMHTRDDIKERYEAYESKVVMEAKIKDLRKQVTQAESVLQMDELKCRLRLLRRLGYTTESDAIEMKGRVACEISAGDELVLTEMIFNGAFNDLTVEQTAALLSCFTCGERAEKVELKPELAIPLKALQDTATKIAQISNECKIVLDATEYVQSFRHELMAVVYAWSLGAKFSQICTMTDIFEGSIIRSMKRLEELLRQMVAAAKAIGNTDLEEKFAACIASIKRDIVFANSLYL